mmetsp:Transcript_40038/g.127398  ORF Transcript_40038/g.127398 Transcript_40038/m.127398 type:complete len:254 (+) Transcript_40038:230-991(+)
MRKAEGISSMQWYSSFLSSSRPIPEAPGKAWVTIWNVASAPAALAAAPVAARAPAQASAPCASAPLSRSKRTSRASARPRDSSSSSSPHGAPLVPPAGCRSARKRTRQKAGGLSQAAGSPGPARRCQSRHSSSRRRCSCETTRWAACGSPVEKASKDPSSSTSAAATASCLDTGSTEGLAQHCSASCATAPATRHLHLPPPALTRRRQAARQRRRRPRSLAASVRACSGPGSNRTNAPGSVPRRHSVSVGSWK